MYCLKLKTLHHTFFGIVDIVPSVKKTLPPASQLCRISFQPRLFLKHTPNIRPPTTLATRFERRDTQQIGSIWLRDMECTEVYI